MDRIYSLDFSDIRYRIYYQCERSLQDFKEILTIQSTGWLGVSQDRTRLSTQLYQRVNLLFVTFYHHFGFRFGVLHALHLQKLFI